MAGELVFLRKKRWPHTTPPAGPRARRKRWSPFVSNPTAAGPTTTAYLRSTFTLTGGPLATGRYRR
jgi:hypothetical protein